MIIILCKYLQTLSTHRPAGNAKPWSTKIRILNHTVLASFSISTLPPGVNDYIDNNF